MKKAILILSYNHPELTAKTVRSALAFSLPIILIHHGSEVKNRDFLQKEFQIIDHFVLVENKGWAFGMNEGLRYAFLKYDWLFVLTNDTEVLTLGDFPMSPALVAPLIYFRKMTRVDSLGGIFTPHLGKLRHVRRQEELALLKKGQFFYVPGTAFLIHKDVFFALHGFDESLHTYWEDVDFSCRAQKMGISLLVDQNFSLTHKVGKTCHSNSFYTTYLYNRNRKRISLKYSVKLKKIIILSVLLKDLLKNLFKFLIKKDRKRTKLYINAMRD